MIERLVQLVARILTSRGRSKPEPPDKRFVQAMRRAAGKAGWGRARFKTFNVEGYELRGLFLDADHYFGVGVLQNPSHRLGVKPLGLVIRTAEPEFRGIWEFASDGYDSILVTREYHAIGSWAGLCRQELMADVLASVFGHNSPRRRGTTES